VSAETQSSLSGLFAELSELRQQFQSSCRQDLPGLPGAQSFAQALLQSMAGNLSPQASRFKDWALIASGGFGRGELSFRSDLDLLFLYKKRLSTSLKDLIQACIAGLWDCGFEVGHQVSSQSGLKELMTADFSVFTTYLETSFIAGDREFYNQWRDQMSKGASGPRQKKRFLDKLADYRHSRFEQYGESIYLLEPNIKEGVGGLRDIHILRWIGVQFSQDPDPAGMVRSGWITEQECAWLEQSQDFLWRVRLQLHDQTSRRRDQLLLPDQELIAKRLGFLDEAGAFSSVEAFMRQYYRYTARLRRVTTFVLEKLDRELQPSRGRGKKLKVLPGPFLLEGDLIRFYEPDRISSHPELLMQFFWQAAQSRAHFHHDTGHIIRQHLQPFSKKARNKPEVIQQFFDILLDPEMAFSVLKVMLETGFLEAFVPEFSHIRYRVQYDVYHVYTVDEHLLRSVRELHRLGREQGDEFPDRGYSMERIFARVSSKRILFLAALIHDLGKGYGSGHARHGAGLAAEIGQRFGLTDSEQDLLVFLVEHHLLLPETALKRDLSEEKPIEHCALTVETTERLCMLYLLTISDAKATGPQVWTSWRKSLLRELFIKVSHFLEQEEWQQDDVHRKVSRVKADVIQMAESQRQLERLSAWLEKLSIRYLLAQSPQAILEHFSLEDHLASSPLQYTVKPLEDAMWEITLACTDRTGLFERVTGVLWANGLNILSADLYTRSYAVALDILIVDGIPDPLHPERIWKRIESDFHQVIVQNKSLDDLIRSKRTVSRPGNGPVVRKDDSVVISEQASDFYTVIEVYTWERPGVLHAISKVLHDFGLSIKTAKISTPGAQVVDVFYVQDEFGNKILDPAVHAELEQALLAALQAL